MFPSQSRDNMYFLKAETSPVSFEIGQSVSQSRTLRCSLEFTQYSYIRESRAPESRTPDSKMVQQDSDDCTVVEFNFPKDREKMRNSLQQYEEVLEGFEFGIKEHGEEYLYTLAEEDGLDPSLMESIIQARHIMAFVEGETEVCTRLNLRIKSRIVLTEYIRRIPLTLEDIS